MLWTLHNRAFEAAKPDGVLFDLDALRIYQAIDYDFFGRFGEPDGSHAVRALVSDRLLRRWLSEHPSGTVVSLGEGLETQSRRVDNGTVRWVSVDLPESIALRERFLPPTERFTHVACSALDLSWMDHVPKGPVYVVAQGLLMYFQPAEVRGLIVEAARRFAGGEMFFDVLPPWFLASLARVSKLRGYTVPDMPWGLNSGEIDATIRGWDPAIAEVEVLPFDFPRGPLRAVHALMRGIPLLRERMLSFVRVRFR